MDKYRTNILVITALQTELDAVKDTFEQEAKHRFIELEHDPGVYRMMLTLPRRAGTASAKSFLVHATCLNHTGMTDCAVATTRMIERYAPQYVVMLGICAGFQTKGVRKGDILIAENLFHYREGKQTATNKFVPDGRGVGLDPGLKTAFNRSKADIMASLNRLYPIARRTPQAMLADFLTGDLVVASTVAAERFLKHAPRHVAALEMEGFALFYAAALASKPKPAAMLIKGVSDFANNAKDSSYQREAAVRSARFFLEFARQQLKPEPLAGPDQVRVESERDQEDRGIGHLIQALEECTRGSRLMLISITGASVLAPGPEYPKRRVRDAFQQALEKGARCQIIIMDPHGEEAKVRSEYESHGIRVPHERLLFRDLKRVQETLPTDWGRLAVRLQVATTRLGLSFGLWLFRHGPDHANNKARVEPYHLGLLPSEESRAENALCHFSHLWIRGDTDEFKRLESHFRNLHAKSTILPFRLHSGHQHRSRNAKSRVGYSRRRASPAP